MPDTPAPSVAAAPPDPDRAALPRVSRLLRLVRRLVDYGTTLLTALQQGGASPRRAQAMWMFGTKDFALIIARITCGLQRAAALEVRLNRYVARGTDLPLPVVRLRAPEPRSCRAAPVADAPVADAPAADHAALLAALPSAEEIAQQVRTRSLGVVITDICHDLGLASGMMEATLWDELMAAVLECGIDLVRFIRDAVEAPIGEDDDADDVADVGVSLLAPCVQAAVAEYAQPP
jgi:hypothetical protein